MKPFMFVAAFLLWHAAQGQADSRTWDIRLAIGAFSHREFKESKINDVSIVEFPVWGKAGMEAGPVISAGVIKKFVNGKFGAGLFGTYQRIQVNYSFMNFPYRMNVATLMPAVSYAFYRRQSMQIYSGAALGIGFMKLKSEQVEHRFRKPAYQLTALGLRAGKKLAFTLEAGYGYQGILAMGLAAGL